MNSKKIKSLIIDDDPFIRDLLQDKLDQYFTEIEVVATAESGFEGIHKIKTFQPDLVFLDVEMGDMTGFEMLAQLTSINFQTIFITSYSHYAIKAIRFNALDYLLKPIDLGELKKAIKRYKNHSKTTLPQENLKLALQNMSAKNASDHMLVLKTQDGVLRLILKDIIRIEGDRNYSLIYLKHNVKKLVSKTLIDLEELLDFKGFYRCHRSHIVNADHIISSAGSNFVNMSDQSKIPISRRKKKEFHLWYDSYQ